MRRPARIHRLALATLGTRGLVSFYNPLVPRPPLALDTSPDVERLLIERWRHMSAAEKAAIVSDVTAAVYELALAGVRQRYPHASPREHFLRLAVITLGEPLARRAYPEMAALDRP
jgi:hypothetical protein